MITKEFRVDQSYEWTTEQVNAWNMVYSEALSEVIRGRRPSRTTHDRYMNALIKSANIRGDFEEAIRLTELQNGLLSQRR